jgi:hypothetical protein
MGSAYSISGYIVALIQRSSPTLLVEGASDKNAIHRLIAERTPPVDRECNIDHSGLFEDDSLGGLGAKAKVSKITEEVQRLAPSIKKLSASFACLVDREWDGLPSDPKTALEEWEQPIKSPSIFVTIGHSIENYHFHVDCFLDYLRSRFPEHYSSSVEESVGILFPEAIALAGAISCQARDNSCISRLTGLIDIGHIELSPAGRFHLAQEAIAPIKARCDFDARIFVESINSSVDVCWSGLSSNPNSRWLLHGHIGSDVLWACVGLATTKAGAPATIGEQISKGFQAERRRCWLTWLSRVSQDLREPLDQAVEWLIAPLSTDPGLLDGTFTHR